MKFKLVEDMTILDMDWYMVEYYTIDGEKRLKYAYLYNDNPEDQAKLLLSSNTYKNRISRNHAFRYVSRNRFNTYIEPILDRIDLSTIKVVGKIPNVVSKPDRDILTDKSPNWRVETKKNIENNMPMPSRTIKHHLNGKEYDTSISNIAYSKYGGVHGTKQEAETAHKILHITNYDGKNQTSADLPFYTLKKDSNSSTGYSEVEHDIHIDVK